MKSDLTSLTSLSRAHFHDDGYMFVTRIDNEKPKLELPLKTLPTCLSISTT